MSAARGSLFDDDVEPPPQRTPPRSAGGSTPPQRSPRTPAATPDAPPVQRGSGGDSEARWAEAEANMAAFGSSVAAVTQLLNGAVFLPADEHAAKLNTQQMSAALMAQGKRLKAAETELVEARAARAAAEADAANAKTALAAHVAELLDTKEQLQRAQDALRGGLAGLAGVSDL